MTMTVNEATAKYVRANFAEVLDRVAIGKEAFLVTKFGKKRVYILPADEVEYKPMSSEDLLKNNSKNEKNKIKEEKKLSELRKFRGIWKDREDFKGMTGVEISRILRKKASGRAYDND